ncbi:MAG: glycosyltransferase 87 family protein [Thermosphaera sp.]
MVVKPISTSILQVFKKPLTIFLFLANGYVLTVIALLSRLSPETANVTSWLYDDKYVVEASLRYYIDFRPGYPPIGKLPIHLIYLYTGGSDLAILVYNVLTFNLSIAVFYYLVERLVGNRTSILKAVILYIFNPALITAFLQPHADFLALALALMGVFFLLRKRFGIVALLAALGFATKIYPVFILVPAMIVAGNRDRIILVTLFVSMVWLLSLPFIVQDPLMYLSTFTHHFYRGPSESIFAVLDGYYGHTGFVHPLFDAAIYYFQFTAVYRPSHEQHFYYTWRYPSLKYIALLIQSAGLIPLCLYAMRNWLRKSRVNNEISFYLSILAFFTYLSLSPTQNVLVHIPAYTLACVLLASNRDKLSTLTLVLYAMTNGLHAMCWSLPYQYIEHVLITTSNLRVLLVALIYLSTFNLLEELRI